MNGVLSVSSWESVSYTHLDVYKRQGIPSVVYGLVGMILLVPAIRVAFDPVSYTHLDVYKRQVWTM